MLPGFSAYGRSDYPRFNLSMPKTSQPEWWQPLPPVPCRHICGVVDPDELPRPDHSSKMVLPAVQLSPPEEARTPRKDRYAKNHRAPNHISKTVLSTVHLGPPRLTKSRTFTLTLLLDL